MWRILLSFLTVCNLTSAYREAVRNFECYECETELRSGTDIIETCVKPSKKLTSTSNDEKFCYIEFLFGYDGPAKITRGSTDNSTGTIPEVTNECDPKKKICFCNTRFCNKLIPSIRTYNCHNCYEENDGTSEGNCIKVDEKTPVEGNCSHCLTNVFYDPKPEQVYRECARGYYFVPETKCVSTNKSAICPCYNSDLCNNKIKDFVPRATFGASDEKPDDNGAGSIQILYLCFLNLAIFGALLVGK